jgi:hypothetical protein
MKKLAFPLVVAAGLLVSCGPTVKIVKFDTRPEAPFKGDSMTLYWVVENADEVTLDGKQVAKDSGRVRVLLDGPKTYSLHAVGSHSERTKNLIFSAEEKK